MPIVPWSCCKVNFPLQCLHDPLQQVGFTNIWVDAPNTVSDSLNTKGCVEKMKAPIGWVIDGFVMIISAIVFLHVRKVNIPNTYAVKTPLLDYHNYGLKDFIHILQKCDFALRS